MSNRSWVSSSALPALLRWFDAGRSSIVVAFGLALAMPSINVLPLDGLPFDRGWELVAFAILLPFCFSGSLRRRLAEVVTGRGRWAARGVVLAALGLVVVKLLLLAVATDEGFVACYASTAKPPPQRCEKSYSNALALNGGATRVDRQIDFGPTDERAGHLVPTYPSYINQGGPGKTDWNLSFANDLRFNEASARHELLPFRVSWSGTADVPSDGVVRVRYLGAGRLRVGDREVVLAEADQPRTRVLRAPPGDQPLLASFETAAGATYGEMRVLRADGDPLEAAGPGLATRTIAVVCWLLLIAMVLVLASILLVTLRSDLWLLGLVAVAAVSVALLSSPDQHGGFQYLIAAMVIPLVCRLPKHPLLWAYVAILVLEGASVFNSVGAFDGVLYRASGSDFLTYESFARDLVLDRDLSGGESVFYYQPGSRYALGFLHLLFGDGDVLTTLATMTMLSLAYLALVSWHRDRVRSPVGAVAIAAAGFLLLAVVNSPTVLSFAALGGSEVPTWFLLPLAAAAPQLQPRRGRFWVGSAAAAALIWVTRTNQALAVGALVGASVAALWRRRPLLILVLATVGVIALLPLIHNLAYGGQFTISTTSRSLGQEIDFGDLDQIFADNFVGGQLRGHVSAMLVDPPTQGILPTNLRGLLWGMLLLWGGAVLLALGRLRRGETSLRRWLLLALPVAYLAPHLVYQVEVYYPRHILAGYLAMGVSGLGALAEMYATARPAWLETLIERGRPLPALAWAAVSRLPAHAASRLRSGQALVAVAFLAPFAATRVVGSLTLGRVAALGLAGAVALDLVNRRPTPFRLGAPAVLAGAAYVGLFLWIAFSASVLGCNCDGKLGGFALFAFVGILAIAAVILDPGVRERAVLALLAGLGLAAALALLGVGALNSGTVDLTQTGGRLSGTYGNANELGLALAFGVPIAAAYVLQTRGRSRVAFAACLVVLAVALVLTFSRGGIIAAGFGLVAVGIWSMRGSRRSLVMILAGVAAAALIAVALYSIFQRERQDASFASVPSALRPLDQRDLSGWESRPNGPIPAGPARLRNRPGGFSVSGPKGGEGVSYGWGEAAAGGRYVLRFTARAEGSARTPISFALGDAVRGEGTEGRGMLSAKPREFELAWRPRLRALEARLYVWQRANGPAAFILSDVSVSAAAGGRKRQIEVPDQLRGSIYAHLTAAAEKEEDRYVRSRLDAADLALDAFVSKPLWGIGWATFPDYAEEHLDYGRLAAHDEYLAFAAELGLIGLGLLGLLLAAAVVGVRRAGRGAADTAAIGLLAAAAAGLVFVEALPIPQLSIAIAIAIGIVCARRPAPPSSR